MVKCKDQEKEDNVNSTNNVNTVGNVNTISSTVNAAGTNEVNAVCGKIGIELPFDPNMPALEDYSIFDFSRDDEDDDHPLDQVIEDLQSATQTRKMSKNLEGNRKNQRGYSCIEGSKMDRIYATVEEFYYSKVQKKFGYFSGFTKWKKGL
ncbi:hypothetical protein Tco_0549282 [Tanacetum coccineum]